MRRYNATHELKMASIFDGISEEVVQKQVKDIVDIVADDIDAIRKDHGLDIQLMSSESIFALPISVIVYAITVRVLQPLDTYPAEFVLLKVHDGKDRILHALRNSLGGELKTTPVKACIHINRPDNTKLIGYDVHLYAWT